MNTTISIPTNIRDQIKDFGNKGETYGDILGRLISKAKERQLEELLLDTQDSIPAKEALAKAKKRWQ